MTKEEARQRNVKGLISRGMDPEEARNLYDSKVKGKVVIVQPERLMDVLPQLVKSGLVVKPVRIEMAVAENRVERFFNMLNALVKGKAARLDKQENKAHSALN